jgi:hypothetical protein
VAVPVAGLPIKRRWQHNNNRRIQNTLYLGQGSDVETAVARSLTHCICDQPLLSTHASRVGNRAANGYETDYWGLFICNLLLYGSFPQICYRLMLKWYLLFM